jgi:hypothetical protein
MKKIFVFFAQTKKLVINKKPFGIWYINIIFISLALFLSGCQKILHEQDTQISIINNSHAMDLALIGMYDKLSMYLDNPETAYPRIYADDHASEFAFGYNTSVCGSANNEFAHINYPDSTTFIPIAIQQNFNMEDIILASFYPEWQEIYSIITSSNSIICQFENQKSVKAELLTGLGEAYLIRAYAYFSLVRIFGEVPIINDVKIKFTVNKSSFADIYAFIVSDLNHAITLLPADSQTARIPGSSPHRGSAKAILAEVYLTMGGYPINDALNYAHAAEMAGEVIDNATSLGFNLLPDIADLWNGNQNVNNETVLGLYYTNKIVNINYSGGNDINDARSTGYSSIGGGDMNPVAIYGSKKFNWAVYVNRYLISGQKFFNYYPNSYRKEATFQTILPFWPNATTMKFINYTYADNTCLIFYKKSGYYFFTSKIDDKYYSIDSIRISLAQPIYIFRYAHTLLTYAEAKARSGQLDASAYEAINKIRRRANKVDIYSASIYDLSPGLSAKQFADSVVRERELELCGEHEGRWYDMVRLEMVELLPSLRSNNFGPPYAFTKEHYFAPIPEEEKVFDPNLK